MSLRPPKLAPVRVEHTIMSATPNAQGYSPPVIGNPPERDDVAFDRTEYVQWAKGGGAQLLTTDYGIHRRWSAKNCIFRFIPGPNEPGWPNGGRWPWRVYNIELEMERVLLAAPGEEHDFYGGIWGDSRFEDVEARNAGSQGLQFSLKYPTDPTDASKPGTPRSSPSWDRDRTLTLRRVNVLECGRRGGTRLGFVVSLFEHGPKFKFDAEELFVQTVKQSKVTVNTNGQTCDSSGGIFLGFCESARIANSTVELKNPEKGVLQAYDYNTIAPSENAPQTLILDGSTFIGGNVDIRLDESPNVAVHNCKGNAKLRKWYWKSGKWQIKSQQAITVPYFQGELSGGSFL